MDWFTSTNELHERVYAPYGLIHSCEGDGTMMERVVDLRSGDQRVRFPVAEASRYAYEPRHPVAEPLGHHTGVGTVS
jgi:hypothetical protein